MISVGVLLGKMTIGRLTAILPNNTVCSEACGLKVEE